MREFSILFRRELKSYFASPIAYVFGGLFLLVLMFFTVPSILVHGQPARMDGFFSWLPIMLVIFIPPLTMRTWAEERKMGTLELLMTFPITVRQMIAGKFFACLAFFAFVMVLTLLLPITLALYADLDLGPVIVGYLASLLLAAAYLAVGMFWSSLTRDQLVAMLAALVSLLVLSMLGMPWFQVQAEGVVPEWLMGVFAAMSPYTYFSSFMRGVIDSRDFVFFVFFCGFFLYLNAMVLQGRRLRG